VEGKNVYSFEKGDFKNKGSIHGDRAEDSVGPLEIKK